MYLDEDPYVVLRRSRPVARKAHHCHRCGTDIAPGERYCRIILLYEDGLLSVAEHTLCPDEEW